MQVVQVPRGEGTQATRDRRARSSSRRGRERRQLRELAAPAAAASAAPPPMVSEGSDGDGGAAPRTRPWPGRTGPPGQRRRVAVAPPPTLDSSVPSPTERAGGYAAGLSSTVSAADAWSALLGPDIG